MLLQDKIAVVTGANRGLGKAVALRFAEEGAKVMLVGRNTEALQAVQKMIEAKRRRCGSVLCGCNRPGGS